MTSQLLHPLRVASAKLIRTYDAEPRGGWRNVGANMRKTLEERFWEKVDRSGGPDACWEWQAYRSKPGYGYFKVDGCVSHAHRIAWSLSNSSSPQGLCVCHRCDNPPCCNPAHLFLGTLADNNADMVAKGRNVVVTGDRHGSRLHPERRPRGERHWKARFTDDTIAEIRRVYEATRVSQRKLARQYGISYSHMSAILCGTARRCLAPLQDSFQHE